MVKISLLMLLSISILDGKSCKEKQKDNLDELPRVPLLLRRLQDRQQADFIYNNPGWLTTAQQEPVRGPRFNQRRNAIVNAEEIRRMFSDRYSIQSESDSQ